MILLTIYLTGFFTCLIYDFSLIIGGLKIKQGNKIFEIIESIFWFISLPLCLVIGLFLRLKGVKVFDKGLK